MKTNMENKEHQPIPDYKELFNKLPFNGHMQLPMSMLSPIIIDDFKSSETEGPIQVFAKKDIIYIDDGNHRFFERKRELLIQNDYKDPDWSKFFMEVVKVDPEKAINSWMLKY